MTYQGERNSSVDRGPSDGAISVATLVVAVISAFLAAIAWGLVRAYTGIFDVLNLRVFVASFIVILPLVLMPAVAFGLSGWRRILALFIPILAMVPVGGGEWLGMMLSGRPIVWQKFNLIWLGLGTGFALIACVAGFFRSN